MGGQFLASTNAAAPAAPSAGYVTLYPKTDGRWYYKDVSDTELLLGAAVASDIPFTPVGDIAATDVQAAIAEVDTEKAPKASPIFTGNVTINENNKFFIGKESGGTLRNLIGITSTNVLEVGSGGHNITDYRAGVTHRFKIGATSHVEVGGAGELTVGKNGGDVGITFTLGWRIRRENATTGDMYFELSGAPKTVIAAATGNVGIGTTNPAYKLDVVSEIQWGSGANKGLLTYLATGAQLKSNTAGDKLYLGTLNFGSAITVEDSAGFVGINETAPGNSLTVKVTTDNDTGISIKSAAGTARAMLGVSLSSTGELLLYDATTTIKVKLDAGGASYINNGSNFGLGTASPIRQLSIYGATGCGVSFHSATTGSTITDGAYFGVNASDAVEFWNYEATYIRFGTSGAERMRIDASGKVGIGSSAPSTDASSNANHLVIKGSANAGLSILSGNTNASNIFFGDTDDVLRGLLQYLHSSDELVLGTQNAGCQLVFLSGAGVEAARVTSDGNVGIGTTSPGAELEVAGTIVISSVKTWTANKDQIYHSTGSGLIIGGGLGGTTYDLVLANKVGNVALNILTNTQNMIYQGSFLGIAPTGGLGYGTGAGGAVTQTGSRTTGVTLNNVCGQITLVSAAGSTTWQSFVVTNSAVAATDVIKVTQASGTDQYEIHVVATAAGSFTVIFRTTGGTTTEQPVFNFAVLKAVAA